MTIEYAPGGCCCTVESGLYFVHSMTGLQIGTNSAFNQGINRDRVESRIFVGIQYEESDLRGRGLAKDSNNPQINTVRSVDFGVRTETLQAFDPEGGTPSTFMVGRGTYTNSVSGYDTLEHIPFATDLENAAWTLNNLVHDTTNELQVDTGVTIGDPVSAECYIHQAFNVPAGDDSPAEIRAYISRFGESGRSVRYIRIVWHNIDTDEWEALNYDLEDILFAEPPTPLNFASGGAFHDTFVVGAVASEWDDTWRECILELSTSSFGDQEVWIYLIDSLLTSSLNYTGDEGDQLLIASISATDGTAGSSGANNFNRVNLLQTNFSNGSAVAQQHEIADNQLDVTLGDLCRYVNFDGGEWIEAALANLSYNVIDGFMSSTPTTNMEFAAISTTEYNPFFNYYLSHEHTEKIVVGDNEKLIYWKNQAVSGSSTVLKQIPYHANLDGLQFGNADSRVLNRFESTVNRAGILYPLESQLPSFYSTKSLIPDGGGPVIKYWSDYEGGTYDLDTKLPRITHYFPRGGGNVSAFKNQTWGVVSLPAPTFTSGRLDRGSNFYRTVTQKIGVTVGPVTYEERTQWSKIALTLNPSNPNESSDTGIVAVGPANVVWEKEKTESRRFQQHSTNGQDPLDDDVVFRYPSVVNEGDSHIYGWVVAADGDANGGHIIAVVWYTREINGSGSQAEIVGIPVGRISLIIDGIEVWDRSFNQNSFPNWPSPTIGQVWYGAGGYSYVTEETQTQVTLSIYLNGVLHNTLVSAPITGQQADYKPEPISSVVTSNSDYFLIDSFPLVDRISGDVIGVGGEPEYGGDPIYQCPYKWLISNDLTIQIPFAQLHKDWDTMDRTDENLWPLRLTQMAPLNAVAKDIEPYTGAIYDIDNYSWAPNMADLAPIGADLNDPNYKYFSRVP